MKYPSFLYLIKAMLKESLMITKKKIKLCNNKMYEPLEYTDTSVELQHLCNTYICTYIHIYANTLKVLP